MATWPSARKVDVVSQGDTVAEARDNLAEALTLFFERQPLRKKSKAACATKST